MKALGKNLIVKRDEQTGSSVIPKELWDKSNTGVVTSVGGGVEEDVGVGDSVMFTLYGIKHDFGNNLIAVSSDSLVCKHE